MILVIDNYDSFVYNLVQYLGELTKEMTISVGALAPGGEHLKIIVYRNDRITVDKIASLKPEYIIISPGPGAPKDAGISLEVIRKFAGEIPILGVCLGHQCIGEAFGGKIVQATRLLHGKTSLVYHDGKTIFQDLPNPFEATRYHSLIVERKSLPKCLEISAWTKEGEIMGLRLKQQAVGRRQKAIVEGVQFHPESILTIEGKKLLQIFLHLKEKK